MKECFCLFSSYPQLTDKDQVSLTNERSFCLTPFESVAVAYCEIKHHFAMHSITNNNNDDFFSLLGLPI